MTEQKITIDFRPDQLADVIEAVNAYADDCPGREPGCSARCCSWTLYESIRNYIYDINHRAKLSLEPDIAAIRRIERAANKDRRGKSYAAK